MRGLSLTKQGMNIDDAGSEAFARFLEFETTFDQGFKFSVAGLMHLERVVGGSGGPTIIRGLIADTGTNWRGDDDWTKPVELVRRVLRETTLLAIVQLQSAIDDFITSLDGDLSRWNSFLQKPAPPGTSNAGGQTQDPEQLEVFCASRGWSCVGFDGLRPVLRFFRFVRNCVAHRRAYASRGLVACRDSDELELALRNWNKRPAVHGPTLPTLKVDVPIDLDPRHVILAIEATHRACAYVNSLARAEFGRDGLVYLAAHYGLLVEDPETFGGAYATPDAVVNEILVDRYHVASLSPDDTIKVLKRIGIWRRCLYSHRRIFEYPPKPRTRGKVAG